MKATEKARAVVVRKKVSRPPAEVPIVTLPAAIMKGVVVPRQPPKAVKRYIIQVGVGADLYGRLHALPIDVPASLRALVVSFVETMERERG